MRSPKKPPQKAKPAPPPEEDLFELSPAAQAAKEVIRRLGLTPPPAPTDDYREAEFPHDLSAVSNESLGSQMSVWVAMLNFAAYQKSLIEINRDHYSGSIKRKVEDHLEAEKNRASTVTEKKSGAMRRSDVRALQRMVEEAEAVDRLLAAYCERYDRNYGAISREITRRSAVYSET